MGKSTISMAMFNSYVSYQRVFSPGPTIDKSGLYLKGFVLSKLHESLRCGIQSDVPFVAHSKWCFRMGNFMVLGIKWSTWICQLGAEHLLRHSLWKMFTPQKTSTVKSILLSFLFFFGIAKSVSSPPTSSGHSLEFPCPEALQTEFSRALHQQRLASCCPREHPGWRYQGWDLLRGWHRFLETTGGQRGQLMSTGPVFEKNTYRIL